jgi:hypothetical protein
MTEQELRELVRQTIARVHGHDGTPAAAAGPSRALAVATPRAHVSHALFLLADSDGPCLIEPAVACNHCGYCKSLGH